MASAGLEVAGGLGPPPPHYTVPTRPPACPHPTPCLHPTSPFAPAPLQNIEDPQRGGEGWPRLHVENRAYQSRAFRKLHLEVAVRQDGLQVRARRRTGGRAGG